VSRLILAAVTPDNTPHGYNWTFGFPMLLFIAVALVLYLLLGRPHRRVPGEPISMATGTHLQSSGAGLADSGSDETSADADPADVDAAVSGEDPGASE
jgi:hypothetical protein